MKAAFLSLAILMYWLNGSAHALNEPEHPIIFIHGFAGSAESWRGFGEFLSKNGWRNGGVATVDPGSGRLRGVLASGDFYVLQFSSNDELTLDRQGSEVGLLVESVLRRNPNKKKVVIVAHSMGGLGARSYLQFRSGGEKVFHLITVGTPHLGADQASRIRQLCPSPTVALALCGALAAVGIRAWSPAVAEIRTNSEAMQKLNDLKRAPLPAGVFYTSIVGTGTPALQGGWDEGDGFVSAEQQNMARIPGIGAIKHEAQNVFVAKPPECAGNFVTQAVASQAHTCETTDSGVWSLIL